MGRVQLISSAEILAHMDLLAEYAAECSIPEIGKINPSAEMYQAMEQMGLVQMFGAYLDGQLAGFASVVITMLPHYSQKVATVESLFVSAPFRRQGIGPELMKAIETHAKEAGCRAILYSAPFGGKLERVLSKRKHSRPTNTVYCLKL